MKSFIFSSMMLFSMSTWALDCKNAISTVDINQCAKLQQDAVEAQLNTVYQNVKQATTDEQTKQALIKAQRAWISFREADCQAAYTKYRQGSIRGVVYIACMQARAEQRIKELNDFNQSY